MRQAFALEPALLLVPCRYRQPRQETPSAASGCTVTHVMLYRQGRQEEGRIGEEKQWVGRGVNPLNPSVNLSTTQGGCGRAPFLEEGHERMRASASQTNRKSARAALRRPIPQLTRDGVTLQLHIAESRCNCGVRRSPPASGYSASHLQGAGQGGCEEMQSVPVVLAQRVLAVTV